MIAQDAAKAQGIPPRWCIPRVCFDCERDSASISTLRIAYKVLFNLHNRLTELIDRIQKHSIQKLASMAAQGGARVLIGQGKHSCGI